MSATQRTTEAAEPDLRRLSRKYHTDRIVLRFIRSMLWLCGLYLCPMSLIGVAAEGSIDWFYLGLTLYIGGIVWYMRLRDRMFKRIGAPIDLRSAIPRCSNVASIPALVELLRFNDDGVRRVAAVQLRRLLPLAVRSDVFNLTGSHWRVLCEELHGDDVALIVEILRMFGRCGDERVLGVVRRAASGPSSSALEQSIRTEAGHALALLRGNLERPGTQLLRASSPPEQEEVLLRAAYRSREEDQEQLLRPNG